MTTSQNIFAQRLKAARGARSQAEFARLLGIKHQQTYQNYERGRIPKADVLQQIASRMSMTVEDLLSAPAAAYRQVHERRAEYGAASRRKAMIDAENWKTAEIEVGLSDLANQLRSAKPVLKPMLIANIRTLVEELEKRQGNQDRR